jgi:hypothetical protein
MPNLKNIGPKLLNRKIFYIVLPIVRNIILYIGFLISLAFIGCRDNAIDLPSDHKEEESVRDTMSILSLGDSYTIGHAVSPLFRFPFQLKDSFRKRDFYIDTAHIVARTGWTTDMLLRGIDQRNDLKDHYDLVTLLIGVNNQYRNYPLIRFIQEFNELLDTAIAFAGGDPDRVIVVSIPDYAYTPFGGGSQSISSDIDVYNSRKEDITTGRGISYV